MIIVKKMRVKFVKNVEVKCCVDVILLNILENSYFCLNIGNFQFQFILGKFFVLINIFSSSEVVITKFVIITA